MKINKETIEQYTDYLSCSHDSIMLQIHSHSARVTRQLSYEICSWLQDYQKNIFLPTDEEIQDQIINLIKNGYFHSIKEMENFIKTQNNTLTIHKEQEELEIDDDDLLPKLYQQLKILQKEEMVQDSTNEVIDQIISYIHSKNRNHEEYEKIASLVEKQIANIVTTKLKKENEKFETVYQLHKNKLAIKIPKFYQDILEQKIDHEKEAVSSSKK